MIQILLLIVWTRQPCQQGFWASKSSPLLPRSSATNNTPKQAAFLLAINRHTCKHTITRSTQQAQSFWRGLQGVSCSWMRFQIFRTHFGEMPFAHEVGQPCICRKREECCGLLASSTFGGEEQHLCGIPGGSVDAPKTSTNPSQPPKRQKGHNSQHRPHWKCGCQMFDLVSQKEHGSDSQKTFGKD